jgi:excisionase family DNA binding protein
MSSNITVQRICQQCGNEFTAKTTTTKYCGDKCSKKAYKKRGISLKIEKSNIEVKAIKSKPMDDLKAKEFLSITDACTLVGISRRTAYRLIDKGELHASKVGGRTIVKRSSIDKFFELPIPPKPKAPPAPPPREYVESEWYRLKEILSKYNISESALNTAVKRFNIPQHKIWRTVFYPKDLIDKIFTTQSKQLSIL